MRLNVIFLRPFFEGRDGQLISAYYKSFGRSKKIAGTQAAGAGERVRSEEDDPVVISLNALNPVGNTAMRDVTRVLKNCASRP
jgi:hypothetical protein